MPRPVTVPRDRDDVRSRHEIAPRSCEVHWLGTVPYAEGLAYQAELVRRRAAGEIPDQLLLLEHPHVVTIGRSGSDAHVLVDRPHLESLGVELFETGRGGDVTYHGPGQLVAYPILDLAPDRCDLHRYVRDLEKVMLDLLADYGIRAHVVAGKTGVWIDRTDMPAAKIGAIGVRVARWITSHGIALNVRTDLQYFDLIVPCGLAGSAVTSLANVHSDPDWSGEGAVQSVARHFARRFGVVFDRTLTGWGTNDTAAPQSAAGTGPA